MAFTQKILTEGQLLGLFTAAAHKEKSAIKNFDSWRFDTEKQLKQLQYSLYGKSHCCPTLKINLIARFEKYIRVIKRFEAQFQMGCPSAKNCSGNTLNKLNELAGQIQIVLMYITV